VVGAKIGTEQIGSSSEPLGLGYHRCRLAGVELKLEGEAQFVAEEDVSLVATPNVYGRLREA
jgi:hypothetical protein